jgi:hypothetical protein
MAGSKPKRGSPAESKPNLDLPLNLDQIPKVVWSPGVIDQGHHPEVFIQCRFPSVSSQLDSFLTPFLFFGASANVWL